MSTPRSRRARFALVALVGLVAVAVAASPARQPTPPAFLLGSFTDDYGSRYEITAADWKQGARTRYRIIKWNVAGQYAIAQNDTANPGDKGLWTRIDWMELPDMAPYTWGYCYSAYNAPTAAMAETVSVAKRATPRTGCNGFPFSRMKRAPAP